MASSDIALFTLAEQRLAYVDQRQKLLAQNVANANTPGFKARDLPPFDKLLAQAGQGVDPLRTDPAHLPGTLAGAQARGKPIAAEASPDGNSVSLDDQLMRVADADSAHDLATGLFRKYLGLFRTALGRS